MAERPIDANLVTTASASTKITEEDKVLNREAKRAKLVEIYERGVVGDRLHVELPDDKTGQWVANETMSIHRMRALGFEIDTEFAPKRSLHDKGDGASYVGDVVYMVADRETRDIIDEIKRDKYERMNNPKKQKEEADFKNQQRALTSAGIGTLDESKAHELKKAEIERALNKTS